MAESRFETVSGIPLPIIMLFLLVYGGLFVFFQVEIGISMMAGFFVSAIVYIFQYTNWITFKQEEE